MSEILIYQSPEGKTKIEVKLEKENIWLTQQQMAELFQSSKQNVSLHIKNIFAEGELDDFSVVKEFFTTASDGKNYKNKLHYAVHGHTAAEIIYLRADSNKPFMGLKNFKGEEPNSQEATIAKNYLDEEELKILSNLVSGYFDFAEILSATGENILLDSGKISNKQALEKAKEEFKKYQEITLSPIEKHYLESIKLLENKIRHKNII